MSNIRDSQRARFLADLPTAGAMAFPDLQYTWLGSQGYLHKTLLERLYAFAQANGLPFSEDIIGGFSPASLFTAGEEGVWYDPSDLTSMYQDSAGTTAAAYEQPVGLLLDKRLGLARGAELIADTEFQSGSGWTVGGAAVIGDDVLFMPASAANYDVKCDTAPIEANVHYEITFTISPDSTANYGVRVAAVGVGFYQFSGTDYYTAPGTYTLRVSAPGAGFFAFNRVAGHTGQVIIERVSVRKLPGNHATQATTASKPILSARKNALINTEDFTTDAWTKRGTCVVVANDAIAPDGTLTADKLTVGAMAVNDMYSTTVSPPLPAGPYTPSVHIKKIDATGIFKVINPANDAQGTWNVDLALVGSGWERITQSHPAVTVSYPFVANGAGTSGLHFAATSDIQLHIWGAQIEPGTAATDYQRVNTATDYDTVGFPHYLVFDGVDDGMATAAINFTGTDKMTVFAGVRKLSDAATGVIVELSATANIGSFGLFAPFGGALANYSYRNQGTAAAAATTGNAYAANTSHVLAAQGDIAGDVSRLRVNGVQAVEVLTDQGTGTHSNQPLYIGRRNLTASPFNGYLFTLTVRGAASTAAQITNGETHAATKTGVSL